LELEITLTGTSLSAQHTNPRLQSPIKEALGHRTLAGESGWACGKGRMLDWQGVQGGHRGGTYEKSHKYLYRNMFGPPTCTTTRNL